MDITKHEHGEKPAVTPVAMMPVKEEIPRASSPQPTVSYQPRPSSPIQSSAASPQPGVSVPGKMVNGVSVAAPGYIPKAGKLTVEDIEAELSLLMERMEFLNKALEEIQKVIIYFIFIYRNTNAFILIFIQKKLFKIIKIVSRIKKIILIYK